MHAPLVLLDLNFALRAGLRVKLEPDLGVVFGLVDALEPLGQVFAGKRPVGFLKATEAPIGAALLAVDIGLLESSALVGECAAWPGAPLGPLADVDKALAIEVAVHLKLLRSQRPLEHCLRDDQLAGRLRASRQDALRPALELSLEVAAVAVRAQLVPALHRHGIFLFVVATKAEHGAALGLLFDAIILEELLQQRLIEESVDEYLAVPA